MCPYCRSRRYGESRRGGLFEKAVLRSLGINAFTCKDCGKRFFHHRLFSRFVNLGRRTQGRNGLIFWFVLLASVLAPAFAFPHGHKASDPEYVVLFGDSITSSWWSLTQTNQIFGMRIANRGVAGNFTDQMLSRFDRDVVQLHPRVVVILGGTNDILRSSAPAQVEHIEHNLQSMTEIAARNGIRVVMATLPPVGGHNPGKPPSSRLTSDKASIEQLNAWIKSEADKNHYVVADYHSVLADDQGFYSSELSTDGIHPSLNGYQLMEPLVRKAVQAAIQ
jgi:lysophospholipase L1-like esterase